MHWSVLLLYNSSSYVVVERELSAHAIVYLLIFLILRSHPGRQQEVLLLLFPLTTKSVTPTRGPLTPFYSYYEVSDANKRSNKLRPFRRTAFPGKLLGRLLHSHLH